MQWRCGLSSPPFNFDNPHKTTINTRIRLTNLKEDDIIKELDINLVLCGHMHGGIVPYFMRKIFKNIGFISPNKKLFPKYSYGKLKILKTNIIISSGIKVIPIKILNIFKPEIVSIKIWKKSL